MKRMPGTFVTVAALLLCAAMVEQIKGIME